MGTSRTIDIMTSGGSEPDRNQREMFWETLKQTLPGPWITNHWNEAQAFTGVAYPVINSICRAMSSSVVQIMRRKRTQTVVPNKTGEVKRAMSQAGAQENDEQWEPIDETDDIYHELKIFERPNPRQSIGKILYEVTLQECLTGSSMEWIVPNYMDTPCEMYVIPTALTFPLPQSPYYPHGAYRVNSPAVFGSYATLPTSGSGIGATIPAEQMAVNRFPHPWANWDGYSPLQAAAIQRDVLTQIDQARLSSATNGVRPSGFILTPAGTTQEQVDQINLKIAQKYAGATNDGRLMALIGDCKVELTGKTIGDLGGMDVWEQMTTFLCCVYNVPKEIVGLVSAVNYAAYFAALKQFYTNTLVPATKDRAEFWTRELILPYWGPDYRVQINPPKIDDEEIMRARNEQLMGGKAITKGELRKFNGLQPFGDERDEEMAGDPSAAEREMKEKELTIAAQKNEQQRENGLPNKSDGGMGVRPKNEMGQGSLGGSMQRSMTFKDRNQILSANGVHSDGQANGVLRGNFREEDHPRANDGKFGQGGGGGGTKENEPESKESTGGKTDHVAKLTEAFFGDAGVELAATETLRESLLDDASEATAEGVRQWGSQFAASIKADIEPYAAHLLEAGADESKVNRLVSKAIAASGVNRVVEQTAAKIEKLDAKAEQIKESIHPDEFDYQAFAESKIPEVPEPQYPEQPQQPEGDEVSEEYEQAYEAWEKEVEKLDAKYESAAERRSDKVSALADKEEEANVNRIDDYHDIIGKKEPLLEELSDKIEDATNEIGESFINYADELLSHLEEKP